MRKKRPIKIYIKKFGIGMALCLLFLLPSLANAHTHKVTLIVDTDMALDDIRALAMILNSDNISIPLIVTSDGALAPQVGSKNLRRVLRYFKREGIGTAAGKIIGKSAPQWRSLSENLIFPKMQNAGFGKSSKPKAVRMIVKTLGSLQKKAVYLCLGPLTNLAGALKKGPGIKDKISRIIFFGGCPKENDPGWNCLRDPQSARLVFNSGIPIYCFNIAEEKLLKFDQRLYDQIIAMNTRAARFVAITHKTPAIQKLLTMDHFRIWDEMIVIYLNQPSLFKFTPSVDCVNARRLDSFKADSVREAYLKLLGNISDFHLSKRKPVVLKNFPTDSRLFRKDVIPYVKRIIERHGFEEWKACLLTNEFHRHLGIYSIVGAKMGIRAREILGAPFDGTKVISLAGQKPPLSCMNDGFQVSTGASLGRGAITIEGNRHEPAAIFIYETKRLTLKVRNKVSERIKRDIKRALKRYGGLNPEYFSHIRKLSLNYWLNLNREEIFDEVFE